MVLPHNVCIRLVLVFRLFSFDSVLICKFVLLSCCPLFDFCLSIDKLICYLAVVLSFVGFFMYMLDIFGPFGRP